MPLPLPYKYTSSERGIFRAAKELCRFVMTTIVVANASKCTVNAASIIAAARSSRKSVASHSLLAVKSVVTGVEENPIDLWHCHGFAAFTAADADADAESRPFDAHLDELFTLSTSSTQDSYPYPSKNVASLSPGIDNWEWEETLGLSLDNQLLFNKQGIPSPVSSEISKNALVIIRGGEHRPMDMMATTRTTATLPRHGKPRSRASSTSTAIFANMKRRAKQNTSLQWLRVQTLILLSLSRSNSQAQAKKSIPHSKQSFLYSASPAWNYSPQIDTHGFLSNKYKLQPGVWEQDARIGGKYGYKSMHTRGLDKLEVLVRQVPGDGNCLFHSLSTALSWVEDRVHLDFDESSSSSSCAEKDRQAEAAQEELDLHTRSEILRQISVDVLRPSSPKNRKRRRRNWRQKPLFLQGSEFLRPTELLDVACSQYGMTGEEYCEQMRNNGVWGGGPEIVALCNYLKRPIHIYELIDVEIRKGRNGIRKIKRDDEDEDGGGGGDDNQEEVEPEFRLRRMACFGSPKFDYREPLHILSADCRFPDLHPGQQACAGNHFMALFPEKTGRRASSYSQNGVRVRSGGTFSRQPLHRRRARSDSIFARREVLSKYLTAGGDNGTSQNGIMDNIMKLVNRKVDDSHEIEVESTIACDNPLQALQRWCGGRRVAFTDVFADQW
jgi:hypothetical protein